MYLPRALIVLMFCRPASIHTTKNMTQKITLTPDIFLSGLGKNEFIWSTSKGQLISIGLFGVFNSPKKRTKIIRFEVP